MDRLDPDCQWLIWRFYFTNNCVPLIRWIKCVYCPRYIKQDPMTDMCRPCNLRRQGFSEMFSLLYV